MKGFALTVALATAMFGLEASAQHDAHAGPMMNYHRIDARLATGGHFVGDGIADVRAEGVEVVIDLRDKPPEGHGEKLEALGIEYINIPVVWRSPERADFEAFRKAMAEHADAKVIVQCQANYRASAFTFLYRVVDGDVAEDEARKDMNVVWEPDGKWKDYVDGILDE